MIIVYNIKGTDGDKVTVEQVIKDFENEMSNPERFDTSAFGDAHGVIRHTLAQLNSTSKPLTKQEIVWSFLVMKSVIERTKS